MITTIEAAGNPKRFCLCEDDNEGTRNSYSKWTIL